MDRPEGRWRGPPPARLGTRGADAKPIPNFLQGFPIAVLSFYKELEDRHTHFHFFSAFGGDRGTVL